MRFGVFLVILHPQFSILNFFADAAGMPKVMAEG